MNTKITSIARIIAILAIIGGFYFLIKDTLGGCFCHCSWIFGLLGLASALLFFLWIRDMIGSDNDANDKAYNEFSGGTQSHESQSHDSSSKHSHNTAAPNVNEASNLKSEATSVNKNVKDDNAKTAKNVLSEEEKSAKLNVLKNAVGVAVGMDDLKEIVGIGVVYEGKLHEMGIKTFEQLAKLTPEAIEAVEQLTGFPGRVEREDWIGQAKKLMNK